MLAGTCKTLNPIVSILPWRDEQKRVAVVDLTPNSGLCLFLSLDVFDRLDKILKGYASVGGLASVGYVRVPSYVTRDM